MRRVFALHELLVKTNVKTHPSKKKHIIIKSVWEAQVSFGLNGGRKLKDLNNGTWLKIYVMEEVTLMIGRNSYTQQMEVVKDSSQKIKNLCDIFADIQSPSSPQNSPHFPLKKQVHVLWMDLMLLVTCNLSLSSCFTVIHNDWFRNWFRYLSS